MVDKFFIDLAFSYSGDFLFAGEVTVGSDGFGVHAGFQAPVETAIAAAVSLVWKWALLFVPVDFFLTGKNILDAMWSRTMVSAGDAELLGSAPDHYTMVINEKRSNFGRKIEF
jgi:hypothetical protein